MNQLPRQLFRILLLMMLGLCLCACAVKPTPITPEPATIRAGLRSSPYGPRNGFPAPSYWLTAARSMASRFEHAVPSLVWIVGTMGNPPRDIGKTLLSAIPNISDLIWVDFTMEEIWPPTAATQDKQ